MTEYDTLFNKQIVAQIITDAARDTIGFAKFFPKIPLEEQTNYYSYFKPELTWEEAKKKGKLGRARKIAEGAEFQPIKIRDYETKTEAFGLVGGKFTLTEDQMTTAPLQSVEYLKESGKLIMEEVNIEFLKFYDKIAEIEYNQTTTDDMMQYLIKAQGKVKNADIDLFCTDSEGYTQGRLYLLEKGLPLTPVPEIKTYFKVANIQFQDLALAKGGRGFDTLQVKGIDINDPGIQIMYSPRRGTTQAPVSDEDDAFAPLMNVKADDTRMKQDPAKMDWFISTQYFFLGMNPENLFKGKFKA